MPTLTQLNNYLVHYRKKKLGANKISVGELERWCKDHQNIPLDENESYAISYKILYEDEDEDEDEEYEDNEDVEDNDGNKFRIFMSPIRLLVIASISSHIHADAIYKLILQGFPVLISGTTDLKKVFHQFGLAICSNKKAKDFKFIFSSLQIGMQKLNKTPLKPAALISDAADSITNGFEDVFNNSYN